MKPASRSAGGLVTVHDPARNARGLGPVSPSNARRRAPRRRRAVSKKGVVLWAMRNRRARRLVVRGLRNRRVRKPA
jgi:hypothetical protein